MCRATFSPVNRIGNLFVPLVFCLLLLTGIARAADEEPFQVEVNILSASIKAGAEPIGAAPRGTMLSAYQFNGSYYLVDLPKSNPPRQGWIAKDDVHRVVDSQADLKRRIALASPEQQQQIRSKMNELRALHDKCVELGQQGKLSEIAEPGKQLAEGTAEVFGAQSTVTADQFEQIGFALEFDGDYATARKYHERALAIRRAVLGETHVQTADSFNNLANVARATGEYVTALKYQRQALAIEHAVFGERSAEIAASLSNLGILAELTGDHAPAREDEEQALAMDLAVLGKMHEHTARVYSCLGNIAEETADFETARKYDEQALMIQREVLGKKHPDVAITLNNLGTVALAQKDYQAAREFFEQALGIDHEVYGDRSAKTVAELVNLGYLALLAGNNVAARKYSEQALAIHRAAFAESHVDTAHALINLALVDAADGQWQAAAAGLQQARRIARRHVSRVLPALSAREQLTFLGNTDATGFYTGLSLGLIQRGDSQLATASAEWLLNGKAVANQALSEQVRLSRAATDLHSTELVRHLLAVRGQLANLSLKMPAPNLRQAYQRQLNDLAAKEEYLSRQLGSLGADVKQADSWISLDDVRRKNPADAMLVDIARFNVQDFKMKEKDRTWQPPRYAAWLIPPSGKGDIRVVDLGEALPIETAVQTARRALLAGTGSVAQKGLKFDDDVGAQVGVAWQTPLEALAAQIWHPLEPHLVAAKEVIISPDAALWLVPWGALPTDSGSCFALEKWRIRYIASGRDIALAEKNFPDAGGKATMFADPDYDLDPPQAVANTAALLRELSNPSAGSEPLLAASQPTALAAPRSMRSAEPLGRAPRLPGTAKEAAAIRPALTKYVGAVPRVYLDRQALEGVFKQIKQPKVLVLSTHGFFLPDQESKRSNRALEAEGSRSAAIDTDGHLLENPLLRCGLLLAGCNLRDKLTAAGIDDGVLTGLEIVGSDLRGTDLVVLSACETGVGEVHNGEGVAGLRQAFQLAGAHAVVASLWQVPDAETSQLMSDLFANLAAGQSKADALRNGQLAMIQASRQRGGSAHPFFWAAFTLTGN